MAASSGSFSFSLISVMVGVERKRGCQDPTAGPLGAGGRWQTSLWDPQALFQTLPPSEPQEKSAPGKKRPPTPGSGWRKFPGWPVKRGNYGEPLEPDDPGKEDRGSAEDAARSEGRREVGTRGCAEGGSGGAVRVRPAPPSSAPAPHPSPPPPAGPSPAPGGPSAQSSPSNFDLGGRLVPPPSLLSSPAPLCKSGSQLLAAVVARSVRWAEPGGGLDKMGRSLRGKEVGRKWFYTKRPGMGGVTKLRKDLADHIRVWAGLRETKKVGSAG